MSAEAIWRTKTDDEIADAVKHLCDYTKEAEHLIRNEARRRGITEPSPTPCKGDEPVANTRVTVVDVQMPFMSMVVFMLKWAIAAIPAGIILFILAMFIKNIIF